MFGHVGPSSIVAWLFGGICGATQSVVAFLLSHSQLVTTLVPTGLLLTRFLFGVFGVLGSGFCPLVLVAGSISYARPLFAPFAHEHTLLSSPKYYVVLLCPAQAISHLLQELQRAFSYEILPEYLEYSVWPGLAPCAQSLPRCLVLGLLHRAPCHAFHHPCTVECMLGDLVVSTHSHVDCRLHRGLTPRLAPCRCARCWDFCGLDGREERQRFNIVEPFRQTGSLP